MRTRKPAHVKRGDLHEVDIVGLTLEGEGVAQLEERAVSISGAFPGERVRARLEHLSRQHAKAHASVQSILVPHPGRRPVPCHSHVAHGGACTGCALMELDEAAQRGLKQRMLADNFGIVVSEVESGAKSLGYRHSAKRVVFGAKGKIRLGSYARGSHRPAPMWNCLVDHPLISAAFADVAEQASALGISAYDEVKGEGDLRYVWAKTDGEHTIVTLITAHEVSRAALELPSVLPNLAGILHSVQGSRTNTIRGTEPSLLRGASELELDILDERIGAGALGFLQPNPEVAALAYRALLDAPAGELAFDLYAGVGLTTRVLRKTQREVIPCEAYAESARALGVEPKNVDLFLAEYRAQHSDWIPDLVIANPPRQGLGERVCTLLNELGAARLHIMSCGPEALARDLKRLSERYELVEMRAFDTLPQTPHVELVAKLARRA